MKRWITPLAFLLAVGLLVCGAVLPQWVSYLQDRAPTPDTRDMDSVVLDIRQQTPLLTRLAMMHQGDTATMRLAPEQAAHTQEQMAEAASRALAPYMEAGLIPGIPADQQRYVPYLQLVSGNSMERGVFWECILTAPDRACELILGLDDETGKLLTVQYSAREISWDPQDCAAMLDAFARIYFAGLEVGDYAEYQLEELSQPYADYMGLNSHMQIRSFGIPREDGTQLRIELAMSPTMFYIWLP